MDRRSFLKMTAGGACSLAASRLSGGAAKDTRPNILFCLADDATFLHWSAYGCDWVNTPGFDRVAREGVLFTRAYTPNAKCAPSRSCIVTGRNSWQLEEAANHWCFFPQKFKTYPEALGEKGYHVGYVAKGLSPAVAGTINGKPRLPLGKAYNARKTTPPAQHISNSDYAGNFADFLDANAEGRPFCFWYGSIEPHRAYEFRAGIEKGGKSIDAIDKVPAFWPDNETVRADLLDYAFEIEYFDKHLQKMLAELEKRNLLDNTIVVVTADNGMPFPRAKGQEYEYSNHLPLAMMWPGGIRAPGRIVDDYVSFIDFAPTFLEAAGLTVEEVGMQPVTGRSLFDIFQSTKPGRIHPDRDHVLIGKERHDVGRPGDVGYPIRGIVKDGYLYIRNFETDRWPAGNPETGYLNCDGSPTKTEILKARREGTDTRYWQGAFGKRGAEELYHVASDPECMINLIDRPSGRKRAEALRAQMEKELREQQDPRILGRGDIFDQYLYANKADRNFHERAMNGEKVQAGWVNASDFEKGPMEDQ